MIEISCPVSTRERSTQRGSKQVEAIATNCERARSKNRRGLFSQL
jgi:hypothetical protein